MADVAALVFDIDSSQARTAATDLAKLNQAAVQMSASAAKTDVALRKANGQFEKSAVVADKFGAEIRQLAAEFNPALSAVYRFQEAELRMTRAVELGVLTLSQKDAALERYRAGLAQAATANGVFAASTEKSAHHATNLMYQLNDIGMMMTMGQSPFMLMMQQGPQVAQIFSNMAAEGKKIGPTLMSAFTSLLSPMTAITLVAIGGAAAIGQWAMSLVGAGEDAATFDDTIGSLNESISRINELNNSLTTEGITQLAEAYGTVTAEVRSLIEAQQFLAQRKAIEDLAAGIERLKSMTGTTLMQSLFGDMSGGVMVSQSIIEAENRIANLRSLMNLSENDARSLGAAMDEAFNAENAEAQIDALAVVRRYLVIIAESGRDGADEAKNMLDEVVKLEDAARRLKASTSGLPGDFSSAADQAGRLAGIIASIRLPNLSAFNPNDNELVSPGRIDVSPIPPPAPPGIGGLDWGTDTTVGGGGGGKSIAEEMQSRWDALNEGLQSELELTMTHYTKDLETLQWALDSKKIAQEEYQRAITELKINAFGAEYEQDLLKYTMDQEALQLALDQKLLTEEQYLMRRRELQHNYYSELIGTDQNATAQLLSNMSSDFAQMNQLAGGGYDGLLKAQKAFAAGSALINAWQGASLALTDPTLTTFQRIMAYGKVLAAGLGAVNAIRGAGKGGTGGGASSSTSAAAAAKAEPVRNLYIKLDGPDWMVDMADSMLTQMYQQSKDGRVIVSRANQ